MHARLERWNGTMWSAIAPPLPQLRREIGEMLARLDPARALAVLRR